MVTGLGKIQPQCIKLGDVGGEGVALAGIIGVNDIFQFAEFHLLVFHVIGAEIVGEVELRRCFRLHADLAVIQLQRGVEVSRPRQHEPLTVIISHGRKIEFIACLPRHAPGRVARENIHFSVLQFLEAFAGFERNEFCFCRIVKDRCRDRAAEIHIESGPVALVVGNREAGQAFVDAAQHLAAPRRPTQGSRIISLIADGDGCDRYRDREPDQEAASKTPHDFSLIIWK